MGEYKAEIYLGNDDVYKVSLEEDQMEELKSSRYNSEVAESFNLFYEKVFDSNTVDISEVNSFDIIEEMYHEDPRLLISYLPPEDHAEIAGDIVKQLGGVSNIDEDPEALEEVNQVVSEVLELDNALKKVDRGALLADLTVEYLRTENGSQH